MVRVDRPRGDPAPTIEPHDHQGGGRSTARRDVHGATHAGPRRHARARRDGRHGVPRRQRVAARRLHRSRGVLRDQRLPDHAAVDRRARAHRHDQPARLLGPTGAAPPPGALPAALAARDLHGDLPVRRARPVARRRDRSLDVRLELVPDLGRSELHVVGRLRPAASRVEPGRGGAVLPGVAPGHGLAAEPAQPGPGARPQPLAAARRGGDHGRDRPALLPRPPGVAHRHAGGLLARLRAGDLEDRHAVPVDADPCHRPARRRRPGDAVAAARGVARSAARQGSFARRARRDRAGRAGPVGLEPAHRHAGRGRRRGCSVAGSSPSTWRRCS